MTTFARACSQPLPSDYMHAPAATTGSVQVISIANDAVSR